MYAAKALIIKYIERHTKNWKQRAGKSFLIFIFVELLN
jgi:hypothetical protein